MSSLNNAQKINYIKNNFHQYFDLKLNINDLVTSETINLVIPIEDLIDQSSAADILKNYEETDIVPDKRVYCTSVIDGDTIWVVDATETQPGDYKKRYKIRFVGIDTPETGQPGYDIAKEFVTQACLHKFIDIHIDSHTNKDMYDRILAVVIVDGKNLNEVLLKENLAVVDDISTQDNEFDPSTWDNDFSGATTFDATKQDINILSPYFASDMSNLVFTPKNNLNVIYRYEPYKDVIYVKLNPYCDEIRMHILPKGYDCNDDVLILRDNMLNRRTITKTNNYKVYNGVNINAYHQINQVDRNRDDPSIDGATYEPDTTYVEFDYNISDVASHLRNLMICAGYTYNQTSPYYSVHYTGVKDNDLTHAPEDRCTLIDANWDNVLSGVDSNNIIQMDYNDRDTGDREDDIIFIPSQKQSLLSYANIDHVHNIEKTYHKKLKYINDLLYAEEEKNYGSTSWVDLSQRS